jgi:galactokinase/mevalonate kinase-like predicted kinase
MCIVCCCVRARLHYARSTENASQFDSKKRQPTDHFFSRSHYNYLDDTIGMAVDLWSEVTVSRADEFKITAEGEGAAEMPKDERNYMVIGCKAAFEAANKPMPTLHYHVVSRIPYARGLGSSSAAIVAGIIAGLILAGHRLPCWGSEALLQIAAGIEVRRLRVW